MIPRIQERFGAAGVPLKAFLVLCFALCVACSADADSTTGRSSTGSSAGFNSTFAIADFDGDQKPDLATVELQTGSSARTTQYSIRLQLATGAAQIFGLTAPAGGLQIIARDVNGDSSLDVLVSSVWLHKQVAVLLNDGHGNFTLVAPDAFPALVWQSERHWKAATMPIWESVALLSSHSSAGNLEERSMFSGWPTRPGKLCLRVTPGVTRLLDFSLLGRSPPTFILQS
jgi:hypothetical protein